MASTEGGGGAPAPTRFVVARADEIPPGKRKIVEVAGLSIGVFNVGGEYFALRNRCPHQGGPLCEGILWGLLEAAAPGEFSYSRKGEILTCGWHGWEFDIRTGQSYCEPRRLRARSYDVHVEPGAELVEEDVAAAEPASPTGPRVKGPYVAETYPVTAEGEYVVVEVRA
jgi:3-phenylpropionate/trans-cinnamate dioxygenase ferredoxin subunit